MGKYLVRDASERASFVILFLLAFKHPEGGNYGGLFHDFTA